MLALIFPSCFSAYFQFSLIMMSEFVTERSHHTHIKHRFFVKEACRLLVPQQGTGSVLPAV